MPEAAFFTWVTRLVRSHRTPLIHLARREGLPDEEAFDAVQEAFHSFLLLPQVDPPAADCRWRPPIMALP